MVQMLDKYFSFLNIIFYWSIATRAPLVAQMAKRLPAMWETWVRSLGQEKIPGIRKWQPTPVLLPGKSYEPDRV